MLRQFCPNLSSTDFFALWIQLFEDILEYWNEELIIARTESNMLATDTPDADLWQTAWDALTSAGIADSDAHRLLAQKPQPANKIPRSQQQDAGAEVFSPVTAPRMHREIPPGSVALIPLGGTTWLEEIASEPKGAVASWAGDLESAHVAATDAMAGLLDANYGREELLFNGDMKSLWPSELSDAEQFYALRDSINFVEQWLPGNCLQYPGLVGIIGIITVSDECVIFSKDISDTRFMGITISQWEALVRKEIKERGGDNRWLDVAFASLYGCICLQNLEKAMLGGNIGVKISSMDWQSLEGYFTRCEIAHCSASSFFLAAYSGAAYRKEYVRPMSIAASSNAIIFDYGKRATGHGGGSVTEVDLGGEGGVEIRMRAHLANRLLSYGCENLPASLTFACYRLWVNTCLMPLLNDRYLERVARNRATVPEAYLKKMEDVLRLTGGSLRIPTTSGFRNSPTGPLPQTTGESQVGGWSLTPECRSHGDEATITAQAPAVHAWLSALKADCHSNPRPDQPVHEPSISCATRPFESLLRLVPTASTSALQELKSVFDGSEYKGRPVGSSSL
jgi:hypothetical protein